jgi:putative flippase GtrA
MTMTTPPCDRSVPPSRLTRWCRFNLVGGIGIFVQLAVLVLLKSVMRFNYLAATVIAVEVAVLHNFVWHERFTWADRTKAALKHGATHRPSGASFRRLLRFHLGNGAVSIFGNLALMKVMVGLGQMRYLLANAIAITVCAVVNFLVSEAWVFERE